VNAWAGLASVLVLVVMLGLLASCVESLPVGQVVAALASVTVATVGLFLFFKKSMR
jgi:hypothetical protein